MRQSVRQPSPPGMSAAARQLSTASRTRRFDEYCQRRVSRLLVFVYAWSPAVPHTRHAVNAVPQKPRTVCVVIVAFPVSDISACEGWLGGHPRAHENREQLPAFVALPMCNNEY